MPVYIEALRLSNSGYVLDPVVFEDQAFKVNAQLGRINVSKGSGDLDGDGDFDRIDVFGARSISIRGHNGELVWDRANFFERLSKQQDLDSATANPLFSRTLFNTTNSANTRNNRSDDKSIEPESVALGVVGGTRYAFVGLERDSGIAVFDLTNPESPAFVTYANNRLFPKTGSTFNACNDSGNCGDLGPEGLTFVPASQSPNGKALLIVSNEVSGTNTIWKIE